MQKYNHFVTNNFDCFPYSLIIYYFYRVATEKPNDIKQKFANTCFSNFLLFYLEI